MVLRKIYQRRAQRLLDDGDLWDALEAYSKARDPEGLIRVGREYVQQGKLAEAEEAFAKANQSIAPDSYIQLGDAAFERGAIETAKAAYERAGHKEGFVRLAAVHLSRGRFDAAEALYREAGSSVPTDRLLSLGYKWLQERDPRLELAAEAFDRAGSVDGLVEVSNKYEDSGKHKEALAILDQAVWHGAGESQVGVLRSRLSAALTRPSLPGEEPRLAPDERKCPLCSRVIKKAALKCRHCGAIFDPVLIEQREQSVAGDKVRKYLRGWGISLLALGAFHLLLAGFLNPAWGVVLIVLGLVNLLLPFKPMIAVNGLGLIIVGLMNMTGGGGWCFFGILQLIWGGQEIKKWWNDEVGE